MRGTELLKEPHPSESKMAHTPSVTCVYFVSVALMRQGTEGSEDLPDVFE